MGASAALVLSLAVSIVCSVGWYLYVLEWEAPGRGANGLLRAAIARRRLLVVPAASVALLSIMVVFWYQQSIEASYQVRLVLMISCLFPIAIIDRRAGIVPNRILLIMLVARVPIYIWEAMTNFEMFKGTARAELATASVIFLFFILLRMLYRGGVGMGDVKLFAVMPLYLGTQLALSAIFGSLVVAFLYSSWLMLSKRKGSKDAFPLCPSILAGASLMTLFVSVAGA